MKTFTDILQSLNPLTITPNPKPNIIPKPKSYTSDSPLKLWGPDVMAINSQDVQSRHHKIPEHTHTQKSISLNWHTAGSVGAIHRAYYQTFLWCNFSQKQDVWESNLFILLLTINYNYVHYKGHYWTFNQSFVILSSCFANMKEKSNCNFQKMTYKLLVVIWK